MNRNSNLNLGYLAWFRDFSGSVPYRIDVFSFFMHETHRSLMHCFASSE